MENKLAVVLPAEVAEIAKNVSVEKRNEVQSVLNHVFNGVAKMREQLDGVTVTDVNDKVNMKLANTLRLGIRQVRLDAEKTFDAKREEVQRDMLSYKTLDQLWLKAKQITQIQTKELEENARWKEETKERFEAEQKELKTQTREMRLGKYMFAPDINRKDFESMSDDTFEIFFAGIEKAHNDKIEAEKKAEAERIKKEKAEIAERERIKSENEKLKAEAEERRIRDNKRNIELNPYIIFIRDYSKMLALPDVDYKKEFEEIKIGAQQHWEHERKEQLRIAAEAEARDKKMQQERQEADRKLRDEREAARIAAEKAANEKAKLEAEIKAKQDAELKAKNEVELKLQADLNKGDSAKVKDLIADLTNLKTKYSFKSVKNQKMYVDVSILIDKIIQHIEK